MKENPWCCPNCDQTSKRPWNLSVHILRKHGGIGHPVRASDLTVQHNQTMNPTADAQNKKVRVGPYAECDRIQEIADELVELKNVLGKYCPKEYVEGVIDICCSDSLVSGNDTLLQTHLKRGRRWVRFIDKVIMLEQGMSNKINSNMLKYAFVQAISNIYQESPSPPQFHERNQSYANITREHIQQPSTAAKAAYVENQGWQTDAYYLYFGESKEEFDKGYQAWLKKNYPT